MYHMYHGTTSPSALLYEVMQDLYHQQYEPPRLRRGAPLKRSMAADPDCSMATWSPGIFDPEGPDTSILVILIPRGSRYLIIKE